MSRILLALLLIAACPLAMAQAPTLKDRVIWEHNGFLSFHPDVKYRKLGLHALEQGDMERAVSNFRQASRFADKPSQAMLAEMYWDGDGVAQDRARAYAWMDLAAERGYTLFVAKRERYWAALDPGEREQALRIGQALYAEDADSEAMPRMTRKLQTLRHHMTGSRVGMVGPMRIHLFTDVGSTWVDGSSYYRKNFWEPERYFEWTDSIWQPMPRGNVRVGDPSESMRDEPEARI